MSSSHHQPHNNKGIINKSSSNIIMQNDPNQWYRCCGDIHDYHSEIQAPPSPQSFSNHNHNHHNHHLTGHMNMMLPLMPTSSSTPVSVVPPQTVSSRSVISSTSTKDSTSKSTKGSSKNKKPRRILSLHQYESLPEHTVMLGRGRESKENPGNMKLHALALMYLDEYSDAKEDKNIKSKIVKQIVNIIEENSAAGTNNKNQKGAPGFVKRNKHGQWEEVSYAAAREKVGYTFRDLLSDRYRSSSKSKVAKLRASRRASLSLGGGGDGTATTTGGGGSVADDDTTTTNTPTTAGGGGVGVVVSPTKPSNTNISTITTPCGSDENPLEWRDDPNVSLKSVFDEVLLSGIDVDVEKTTSTPSKKKSNKTNNKKRNLLVTPRDVIKPLSVQSSSFVNTTTSFLRSSISSNNKNSSCYDKNPILLSEFEDVFCQVFGELATTPVAAAAASASATTVATSTTELLPSATARLRPRKRRRVCTFIVRSGGEMNSN